MTSSSTPAAPVNHERSNGHNGLPANSCSCGKTGLLTGRQRLGHEAGAKRRGEFVHGMREVAGEDGRERTEYLDA